MNVTTATIANWGNFPTVRAQVFSPETPEAAALVVSTQERLIARGNGKCYGDASLGPVIVSTLSWNRILAFDAERGIVHCEAGVLLADLLDRVVPAGWFFHVTPGIKYITVGGAVASDVHGKNHPVKGCFSDWLLDFRLLRADGSVVQCSRTENASLFWQTCGGMGWTGIVLSARFQLMPLQSVYLRQKTVKARDLDALIDAFGQHKDWTYAAAWVDCLPSGAGFGRGLAHFAEHLSEAPGGPLVYPQKRVRNVPFFAPSGLLNNFSIGLHNRMLFSRSHTGEQVVDIDRFFYPLDRLRNWNRLYGRRGFVQYQFCLPEAESPRGMRAVLEAVRRSGLLPFLTVLKRHGERSPEAVNSFPIRGYSLALDFPRTAALPALVRALDDLVWEHGGKIYLTKDACSAGRMGRVDPSGFGEPKFYSLLKARIMNDLA